ncbi:Gb3_synth domain-containing protein [Psidium guajava]|nr:Gb3_synth domain-containing protein [Psidium guajava]
MVISEITEEKDEDEAEEQEQEREAPRLSDAETQKTRIRQIIDYQKSLYWSSSSSLSISSSAAIAKSHSPLSSSRRSSSLMELMKSGSTSLRRLFDMEHTSLADYLDEYSATPVVKTVPLWGSSDLDADQFPNPWDSFKTTRHGDGVIRNTSGSCGHSEFASHGTSFAEEGKETKPTRRVMSNERKLKRKRSFRRLPSFGTWKWRAFRFRLRLRRLRIMICGRKF